jgi:hypothetical protein
MLAKVLVAKMPVNASVHQPMAYCTADFSSISSVGSAAGFLLMQKNKKYDGIIGKSFEKYSRRSRYGDCTNYTKEERFICGNKNHDEEGNLISLAQVD